MIETYKGDAVKAFGDLFNQSSSGEKKGGKDRMTVRAS